ncbi:MAG: tyrosine--tRNA ligase [Candidatus Taylorbacteria bacterium]|nr:tyrosine--tRNA ligase [Candidatus Taylorbacteria bacterium]
MENQDKIDELLTRGVERVYPSKEFLKARLESGQQLTIYYGIDPTSPTLHLGHAVNLLKLRAFQDLGHQVIILYGGFTAQIGDPTDKLATRQPLSSGQIKKNVSRYKKLIGKVLNLKKANIRFLDNEQWSNKLKPRDLMDLASKFTVPQLLERDMFQERIKQGKEIRLHEFLYPLFQAYDAVTMDVDIQLGGNDQTFNMLAGRTLMRKMKNREKAVLAMKMLVDPTGKKMGKTEGNMVSLDEKPDMMFGKIMSWPDDMIVLGFELCTATPLAEVTRVKTDLAGGKNPRDSKLLLAESVVAIYHGVPKAKRARENFLKTFSEGKTPDDIREFKSTAGSLLSDCLLTAGIISSKAEWRRLVGENAVSMISPDGTTKIADFNFKVGNSAVFKIGKHRFLRIVS